MHTNTSHCKLSRLFWIFIPCFPHSTWEMGKALELALKNPISPVELKSSELACSKKEGSLSGKKSFCSAINSIQWGCHRSTFCFLLALSIEIFYVQRILLNKGWIGKEALSFWPQSFFLSITYITPFRQRIWWPTKRIWSPILCRKSNRSRIDW